MFPTIRLISWLFGHPFPVGSMAVTSPKAVSQVREPIARWLYGPRLYICVCVSTLQRKLSKDAREKPVLKKTYY